MLTTDPIFRPAVQSLETPRLSIRIDTLEDYVKRFQTSSDSSLKEYFGISTEKELEKQKEKIQGGLTTYRTSVLFFHLIERSSGKVIGNFAYHNWYPMHSRSEIGYAMASDHYQNQGYMREAIGPILAFGFKAMDLNRMEAFIDPDNIASIKLVTRAGFRKEAYLKERYCYHEGFSDAHLFSLLKSDYVQQH